jgi:NAD(P)-dependent dehydrogenase (short-subunit alcohol dehydrogenase family)
VVFDDIDFAFRDYDPWAAYGQSKTANVLFAVGATARWASERIVANACMPGGIATNLQRHVGGAAYGASARALSSGRQRAEDAGARTRIDATVAVRTSVGLGSVCRRARVAAT